VAWRLKVEIVEQEDTSITRRRLDKHVPAAKNTQATTDLLFGYNNGNCVFYVVHSEEAQSVEIRVGIAGRQFWRNDVSAGSWRISTVRSRCHETAGEDAEDLVRTEVKYEVCGLARAL
jgi:predicted secreted protein